MSRVILKNIPKVFTEKEIVEHFRSVDQISDCKVIRDASGENRRFAFVGFKGKDTAALLTKKYDNTYLGASKIRVQIAKLRQQQEQERSRTRQGKQPNPSNSKGKKQEKTFEKFKKIVTEQAKKSWDDLIVPEQPAFEEETTGKSKKKNQKGQKTEEQAMDVQQTDKSIEKSNKKASKSINSHKSEGNQQQQQVKTIKAPRLSEKNKKFVTKPLQVDSNRLYVTNIPYKLSEEQIKTSFSRFGSISKIKLPKEYDGNNKGYFFITYEKSEEALRAFSQMDNKVVFGRIIHIKPSLQDIGAIIKTGKQAQFQEKVKEKYGQTLQEKSSYKKQKKRQMREKLNDTTSWNTLFLNPNTILQRMAKKLHITKSEILLSDNLAPKVALAEAEVIAETKDWLQKEAGVDLSFLQKSRDLCDRSKKTILVKNLNFRTQQTELKELLEFYGVLSKLLVAPNRAVAIAQFQNAQFAENVMKNLQNHKFKNNFLYLQYAPIGMIKEEELQHRIQKLEKEVEEAEELSRVVYVKNINFQTEQENLAALFKQIATIKYAKIVKNKHGKSMGFGFAEYETHQKAVQAVKKLNNALVDGHKLLLTLSKKKVQSTEDLKELKTKLKTEEVGGTKLLVKNLAFQATLQEVRDLFSEFGAVKKVRLPQKMNGQHRGFAFVQFQTAQESALAKSALSSAHLYGRKLIIQYEKGTAAAASQ